MSGAGTIYDDIPQPGATFSYTFAMVNTATGNIDAFDAGADLSNAGTFPGGDYCVYGLSYDNTANLATYVGGSFSVLQQNIALLNLCGELTIECVPVTINCLPPSNPTVTTPINYCQNETANPLTATGTALKWYTVAIGGTALSGVPTPITPSAGTTVYYVSQTVGGCESNRAQIDVVVTPQPNNPTVTTPVNYCENETAIALTATGTALKWYTATTGGIALGAAPTPITTSVGTTAYYVSQTVAGCESNRVQIDVVVATQPDINPINGAGLITCNGSFNLNSVALFGTNLSGGTKTFYSDNSGTPSATPLSSGVVTTTGIYWIEYGIGTCKDIESATVYVYTTPDLDDLTNQNGCDQFDLSSLTITGTDLNNQFVWYPDNGSNAPDVASPLASSIVTTNGTYWVRDTINHQGLLLCYDEKPISITIDASSDAEFSYSASSFCQNESNPTVSHTTGTDGVYSSTIGLSINASTGEINLIASTAGTYTITNTIAANGACPMVTHTAMVTIDGVPNVTFSYDNTSLCKTGGNPALTAPASTGGTFSSTPAGLVIDANGTIDVAASTVGTYDITYSITSGVCATESHTVQVSVVDGLDAEFSYGGTTTFCQNGTDAVVSHVTGTDGVYSADDSGLSIDGATGAIDVSASTAGSYVVTNTIVASGSCPAATHTVNVVIEVTPDPTFSYDNTSLCKTGGNPILTAPASTGGTFSSTPAGLVIDANGTIDVAASTVGTYDITYSITTGTCNTESHVVQVSVVDGLDAEFSYGVTTTFCQNGTDAVVSHVTGTDGVYSADDSGLSIDGTTGAIDVSASTPGSYVVTNTIVASGSCPAATHTVNVVIEVTPDPTFSYDNTSLCRTGNNPILTAPNSIGGIFSFTPVGLVMDAGGNIDAAASTVGTYDITYSITTGTCNTESHTVQVSVVDGFDAEFSYGVTTTFCQNGTDAVVSHVTGTDGVYSADDSGLSIDGTTGAIDVSASTPGSYVVTNTIVASGSCPAATHTVNVVIEDTPDPIFSYDNTSLCKTGGNPILTAPASIGGTFSSTPAGLVMDAGGNIDVAASTVGTYDITYSITTGTCNTESHVVQVSVVDGFDAEFSYGGTTTYCQNGVDAAVSHATGTDGVYSADDSGLSIDGATGAIDVSASTAGSYVVTNTIVASGSCPAATHTVNIVIEATPDPTFSYDNTSLCRTGSNPILTAPISTGGTFSSTPVGLVIDAGGNIDVSTSTVGTYDITYSITSGVCNTESHVVQVSVVDGFDAEFSYGGTTTYCQNGIDAAVSHTTGIDGVYSADDSGLSIDGTTGAIDVSASTPGSYVVTNTIVASGSCPAATHTVNVVIEDTPDPIFSYDNTSLCRTGSNPILTAPISTGGTFSSTPVGLVIDAGGNIDVSTSTIGTYDITYSITTGACNTESHVVQVSVVDGFDAEFSYDLVSYCQTGSLPILSHATGTDGVYTFNALGATGQILDLNPLTGAIDLSNSDIGMYEITNTIAAVGACVTATHSFIIDVSSALNAGTAAAPYEVCNTTSTVINLNSLITGEDLGGSWSDISATPATGTAFTGGVTGSFDPLNQLPTTYTFRYELSDGGFCADAFTDVVVEIIDPCCPILTSHAVSSTLVCDGETVNFEALINASSLTLDSDYTVSWTGPSGTLSTGIGNLPIHHSGTTACNETQTYTLSIFCNNDNSIVATETHNIDVAPDISAMAIDPNTCVVSITPDCADWTVSWDDGQGNTGTLADLPYDGESYGTDAGTIDFTITNPNAPSTCSSAVVSLDFECCIAEAGNISLANGNQPCPEEDIMLVADGTATVDVDYTLHYLIADETGMIQETNDHGVFSGYAAGNYTLYSYTYYCTFSRIEDL